MNPKEQLVKWLNEIARFSNAEDFVQWVEGENGPRGTRERVKLYTRNHCYTVSCRWLSEDDNYLGGVVENRMPRAGETWTRGRDLADGKFSRETWDKIKNDIISFELVKIAKKVRSPEIIVEGPGVGPSIESQEPAVN